MTKTLRERCREMLDHLRRDDMMRQGLPVDELMAFVLAEKGRAADTELAETLPLCLYFANDKDRDNFIGMIQEFKPNMITKKLP